MTKKEFLVLCLFLLPVLLFAAEYDITCYGAKGDGKTVNTTILQNLINQCSNNGGGTVRIPAGVFVTGSIFMRSHVMLYLEHGAVLRASGNLDDYPEIRLRSYSRDLTTSILGLIQAENITDFGISGIGTIDGRGEDPVFHVGSNNSNGRLHGLNFYNCKRFSLTDISVINTSFWTIRINRCEDVVLRGIKIDSNWYFNADGIDIDGRNIIVSDCIIDCLDDAICLKSYYKDFPCENITITNCVVSSSCNAVKFGTPGFGGFINITISNIVIKKPKYNDLFDYRKYIIHGATEAYLNSSGIALELVDGGVFDRVIISDITMTNVLTPIFVRLAARRLDEQTPMLRNLIIDNVVAAGNSLMSCSITGIPGYRVENVTLSNIYLRYPGGGLEEHTVREIPEAVNSYPENKILGQDLPAYGFFLRHVQGITLQNVQFNLDMRDERHAVYMDDCHGVRINTIRSNRHDGNVAYIKAVNSTDIAVSGFNAPKPLALFFELCGTESNFVKLWGNDFTNVHTITRTSAGALSTSIHEMNNYLPKTVKR